MLSSIQGLVHLLDTSIFTDPRASFHGFVKLGQSNFEEPSLTLSQANTSRLRGIGCSAA